MDDKQNQLAGMAFLDFTVRFFTMAKNLYRHENQIRAHSLAFQTLIDLDSLPADRPCMTMSELAENLKITKQQLTKLVNDLEEKQLVERLHDKTNRRLVNISITTEGRMLLEQLKNAMLQTTLGALSGLSDGEIQQLKQALTAITPLIVKMTQNADAVPGLSSSTPDEGMGNDRVCRTLDSLSLGK